MEANVPTYNLAGLSKAMGLWNDRKAFISVAEWPSASDFKDEAYVSFKRCKYHKTWHAQLRRVPKSRSHIKTLNMCYPFSCDVDKRHTNMDLTSFVFQACRVGLIDKVNRALRFCPLGRYNITATAIAVMTCGTEASEKMLSLWERDRACCLSMKTYPKYCQSIGTALRRNAKWFDRTALSALEVSHLAYWDLPIGRHLNVSDWPEEARKRNEDVTHIKDPWTGGHIYNEIQAECVDILRPAVVGTRAWMSWKEFCDQRQNWVSSGSSGGAKFVVDGEVLHLKKRAYFDSITTSEMMKWLYSAPIIQAKGSEKYEMGKARPIYGTQPLDYAIMAYVIQPIEARMSRIEGVEQGLTGFDEMAAMKRRAVLVDDPYVECTMVDYADFNFQHTPRAQAEVFRALLILLKETGHSETDLLTATKWCADALENQWSYFPHQKENVKINQGLFSGVRGTNFINTVLNIAYFNVAARKVKERLGLRPIDLYHLHLGDDVWLSNRSRLWAGALYTVMLAMGFEMRASKQLFDRAVGEFLRVRYVQGDARGYLMRAVGTTLMRPVQSEELGLPHEMAVGLNNQVQLLVRRGLDLKTAGAVWWGTVKHALSIPMPRGGGISIPMAAVMRSVSDGGLDLGPPGTVAMPATRIAPLPVAALTLDELASELPSHMSEAWLDVVSSQIKTKFNRAAVNRALHVANVSGSQRPIDKVLNRRQVERSVKKWMKNSTLGSVGRVYQELNPKNSMLPSGKVALRGALQTLRGVTKDMKNYSSKPSTLATIAQAVAASPFKDVSTARRALGVGVLEAVRVCLSLCPNKGLAASASSVVEHLSSDMSPEIAREVIGGMEPFGSSYNCLLHPVLLSWLLSRADDLAYLDGCDMRLKNVEDWRSLVRQWRDACISVAIDDKQLISMSKY
nr:RNA-directed RNA polymerase [Mute swan feces associated toti-like virus 1]